MKKFQYLLLAALVFVGFIVNAQSFGVGTASPNPKAALDVVSINQGFLAPRLTTAQRTAMSLAAADKGMLVFDTDLNTLYIWGGSAWGITLNGFSNSSAGAISGTSIGTGQAGVFVVNNPSHVLPGLQSTTNGLGYAGQFSINNAANGNAALFVSSNGTGSAIYSSTIGTGAAGSFVVSNPSSVAYALVASHNGTGASFTAQATGTGGASYFLNGASSANPAVNATTNGTGNAGFFKINNAASGSQALSVLTIGTGNAGYFLKQGTGSASTIYAQNEADGVAGDFRINNAASNQTAIYGTTNGIGSAGFLNIANASSSASALYATTNGTGIAGFLNITNASSNAPALYAQTNGAGNAIFGWTTGTSGAGNFVINNAANIYSAVAGTTNGVGIAGDFRITNSSSGNTALYATTNGTGNTFMINHTGASGNLALFQSSSANVARIDKTGKGFFNGGTQASGADVAEMFDIKGARNSYEPGDVLVISESTDRTMEQSNEPNSTKVAGVYATKPGVILTEAGIDENIDDMVPVGVMGVIPTKVCGENGAIKRGDLLVTSSVKGHAMKAISKNGDGVFPSGAILGKALENFDGNGKGLIKVLVNVK